MTSEDGVLGLFLLVLGVSGALLLRFRDRRDSWFRLLVGNLLVFVLLFSTFSLFGEVYYRFVYDSSDSLVVMKVGYRWFERHYRRNSAGFRDNIEYYPEIRPAARRVSFLGDSLTAGQGIRDVDDRFANRIRHIHPEWEVHVLANAGWETDQELGSLRDLTEKGYQLDHVVLVYCLNDIQDLSPQIAQINRAYYSKPNWFIRSSYLFNTIYYRVKARTYHGDTSEAKDYWRLLREAYFGPLWDKQEQRLRALKALVERKGGHLSVVIFPFVHAVGPNNEFYSVHAQLERFWRQLDLPYLDLLAAFQDLPSEMLMVNRFDVHPNEYANKLATDSMDNFLRKTMSAEEKGDR
jgi:hypothetical protein